MKTKIDPMAPAASERLISYIATKVMRRIRAAGDHTTQPEDIQQELWVAWCMARDTFDPTKGARFSTYLYRGLMLRVNRYQLNNVERRHAEVIAMSMDYSGSEDGEEASAGEYLVASDAPTQDELLSQQQAFDLSMRNLSERAKTFVRLLHEQPPALLAEVERLRHKSRYARERGITAAVPNRLTAAMLFDLMDTPRMERREILAEISSVTSSL